MRKGSTDPGFKGRMIIGHVSTTREPGAIEPLQRAQLEVEPAAYLDFRHDHRRKLEPADFALWVELGCLNCDVIPAVCQRRDLGVVPLVTKPLSVGESLTLGPGEQSLGGLDYSIALVGPGNADVCHGSCGNIANSHPELVGIMPRRQAVKPRLSGGLFDGCLQLLSPRLAPRRDVEPAG